MEHNETQHGQRQPNLQDKLGILTSNMVSHEAVRLVRAAQIRQRSLVSDVRISKALDLTTEFLLAKVPSVFKAKRRGACP